MVVDQGLDSLRDAPVCTHRRTNVATRGRSDASQIQHVVLVER
jgi:hypothetical protein